MRPPVVELGFHRVVHRAGDSCQEQESPTCAPDRPSKILLVQVGTLSSSPIPRLGSMFSFFLSLPPPPSPPAHHRGSAARAGGEQLLPPLAPLSPSTHAPGVCAVCAVPAAAGHDWPSRCGDARHDAWWWLVNDVELGWVGFLKALSTCALPQGSSMLKPQLERPHTAR